MSIWYHMLVIFVHLVLQFSHPNLSCRWHVNCHLLTWCETSSILNIEDDGLKEMAYTKVNSKVAHTSKLQFPTPGFFLPASRSTPCLQPLLIALVVKSPSPAPPSKEGKPTRQIEAYVAMAKKHALQISNYH